MFLYGQLMLSIDSASYKVHFREYPSSYSYGFYWDCVMDIVNPFRLYITFNKDSTIVRAHPESMKNFNVFRMIFL